MKKLRKIPPLMVITGVIGGCIISIIKGFNISACRGFDQLIANGLILMLVVGVLKSVREKSDDL